MSPSSEVERRAGSSPKAMIVASSPRHRHGPPVTLKKNTGGRAHPTDELLRRRHENLGRLLTSTALFFQEQVTEQLRNADHPQVKTSHNAVLMNIGLGGTRQTDIAARAGVTRQAIGQLVDELIELGYVERRPDPKDGRAHLVMYTSRGVALLNDGMHAIDETEMALRNCLGETNFKTVQRALLKLVEEFGLKRSLR